MTLLSTTEPHMVHVSDYIHTHDAAMPFDEYIIMNQLLESFNECHIN